MAIKQNLKIVTILGARPQFIKAAPVSRALQQASKGDLHIKELLLHTGQHFDLEMSQVFFDELGLAKPVLNLGVGGDIGPASQIGKMLTGIESFLDLEKPDWIMVYGDTNSTLAGALAAVKSNTSLAHIEAGLRSFNRQMPEEHNRVLTDHCADLLFCPTHTAVKNLLTEGISAGVHWTGDVMYDATLQFCDLAARQSKILEALRLSPRQYYLVTIHRAYNSDDPDRLMALLSALSRLDKLIVLPLHPRTRKRLLELNLLTMISNREPPYEHFRTIPPVGYLDMLSLEKNALRILTDSGGVQKEAYFFAVPCITLRPETEWVETVENGWNRIVDVDPERIFWATSQAEWPDTDPPPIFGTGNAASQIVDILLNHNGH